ncbi:hypothetical protein GCM10027269_45830 [Kribbella endophytica]
MRGLGLLPAETGIAVGRMLALPDHRVRACHVVDSYGVVVVRSGKGAGASARLRAGAIRLGWCCCGAEVCSARCDGEG